MLSVVVLLLAALLFWCSSINQALRHPSLKYELPSSNTLKWWIKGTMNRGIWIKNCCSIPWSPRSSSYSCRPWHTWSYFRFSSMLSCGRWLRTSPLRLQAPDSPSCVWGIVLVFIEVIEEIQEFLIDSFRLTGARERLFEVLFCEHCRHGGQGLGLAKDGGKELPNSLWGDLSLFGEVGEHFVDFVISHKELFHTPPLKQFKILSIPS